MQQSTYAISGGKEGKSRLNILAAAMQSHTQAWLINAGVRTASSFLDAGCGGGNVALLVTNLSGRKCRITGIDFDNEILKLAKEDALRENVHNIQYLHKNIYEMDFENEFDFVYARFLLSHLSDPLAALCKMKDAAMPGGKIIAEDIQFSKHFSYPFNRAFDLYIKLYPEIVKRRGGNAELGVLLPELFTDAGIKIIAMDVIQPVFISGEGKQMAYETMDKIKNALIEEKIENAETVNEILQNLKKFTEDDNSLISFPAIYRIAGIKN
jgi:ubiquinone/menaquinone biosynthesis C-methylase UbiE